MLWKSVVFLDAETDHKKYFCVVSILKTTFAKKNIYFIEYRINYES